MTSVLITAFEPYDRWSTNSSWLALIELTKELPADVKLVTRRYPVDFEAAKERLYQDLAADHDFAVLLGQAPGLGRVHLESVALNVGGAAKQLPDEFAPLVDDGPVAYRTTLPLTDWARQLRGFGIPAQVSFHAGAYLCNALYYLAQHRAERERLKTRSVFVHLPLAPTQVLDDRHDLATMSPAVSATALRWILGALHGV